MVVKPNVVHLEVKGWTHKTLGEAFGILAIYTVHLPDRRDAKGLASRTVKLAQANQADESSPFFPQQ